MRRSYSCKKRYRHKTKSRTKSKTRRRKSTRSKFKGGSSLKRTVSRMIRNKKKGTVKNDLRTVDSDMWSEFNKLGDLEQKNQFFEKRQSDPSWNKWIEIWEDKAKKGKIYQDEWMLQNRYDKHLKDNLANVF